MSFQEKINSLCSSYPAGQILDAIINYYYDSPFMATGIDETIDEIDYLGPNRGVVIGYGTKYEITIYNHID